MFYNRHKWYHCIRAEPRKAISNTFTQAFLFTIRSPKGILALPKKNFRSPKGILASLKEIIRCPKEKWPLTRFWDRRKANQTLDRASMEWYIFWKIVKKNSPSSRRRKTTWGQSRWQIENFSCDHVLIPSNIRNRQCSETKKIGEYRIEIVRVRCGLGFYCYTHSITHSFNALTLKMIISNLYSESRKCYLCYFLGKHASEPSNGRCLRPGCSI